MAFQATSAKTKHVGGGDRWPRAGSGAGRFGAPMPQGVVNEMLPPVSYETALGRPWLRGVLGGEVQAAMDDPSVEAGGNWVDVVRDEQCHRCETEEGEVYIFYRAYSCVYITILVASVLPLKVS